MTDNCTGSGVIAREQPHILWLLKENYEPFAYLNAGSLCLSKP